LPRYGFLMLYATLWFRVDCCIEGGVTKLLFSRRTANGKDTVKPRHFSLHLGLPPADNQPYLFQDPNCCEQRGICMVSRLMSKKTSACSPRIPNLVIFDSSSISSVYELRTLPCTSSQISSLLPIRFIILQFLTSYV
jgi:hypothetical protein